MWGADAQGVADFGVGTTQGHVLDDTTLPLGEASVDACEARGDTAAADPAFEASHLARWQQAWPDAPCVELDGVGHFPQEEAPGQVIEALRGWV